MILKMITILLIRKILTTTQKSPSNIKLWVFNVRQKKWRHSCPAGAKGIWIICCHCLINCAIITKLFTIICWNYNVDQNKITKKSWQKSLNESEHFPFFLTLNFCRLSKARFSKNENFAFFYFRIVFLM